MKKRQNQVDRAVEQAFYRHGQNAQINIFDLGKIMDAGRTAHASGQDVDAAVIAAIAQYRQN